MRYRDYLLSEDVEIVREVQEICAAIHEVGLPWTRDEAVEIGHLIRRADNPRSLFMFMDEKTGSSDVGYRTQDGREWFHILRQMRNTKGSGLFEAMQDNDTSD